MSRRFVGCVGITAAIGAVIVSIAITFVVGVIVGEQSTYQRHFENEKAIIDTVLGESAEFSKVTVQSSCSGNAYLTGTVPDHESLERLRSILNSEIGRENEDSRMRGVEIE